MKTLFVPLLLLGLLTSCAGVRYDRVAWDNVNGIIHEVPTLLDHAAQDPYSKHETAVNKALEKINTGYTHAAATKKNQDVAEQWRVLRDEMVVPFVNRWKEKGGKLDKDFVTPATKQIKDALLAIERTESAKRGAPKKKVVAANQ